MRHVPNSFASLFSGCGGFDLGFKQAGFLADAAFDHDREAVENYRDYPRGSCLTFYLDGGRAVERQLEVEVGAN